MPHCPNIHNNEVPVETAATNVNQQLDPFQFAYRAKGGTEDAVACLLHHVLLQHLDSPGDFTRILFVGYSSAFITMQRHLMIRKLQQPILTKEYIKKKSMFHKLKEYRHKRMSAPISPYC